METILKLLTSKEKAEIVTKELAKQSPEVMKRYFKVKKEKEEKEQQKRK